MDSLFFDIFWRDLLGKAIWQHWCWHSWHPNVGEVDLFSPSTEIHRSRHQGQVSLAASSDLCFDFWRPESRLQTKTWKVWIISIKWQLCGTPNAINGYKWWFGDYGIGFNTLVASLQFRMLFKTNIAGCFQRPLNWLKRTFFTPRNSCWCFVLRTRCSRQRKHWEYIEVFFSQQFPKNKLVNCGQQKQPCRIYYIYKCI